ncbi:hypothetical protein Tco_1015030 [Tanacetum coccineum]|uniref:Uncharacterized protein n=1 Tax=Tanacetum coccineum TaxID=301880 RepID=A0ABQ5FJR3_9ASTR
MPKSHTRNHHILPNKSVNARRAAYHNRKLNVIDHNQFVIRSLKYTAWRPIGKVVGSVKPQWKPTGRHFALYDNCPLTRIMEPIVEPLELTPSVSSSSKVTMISRFPDCNLSDRKGQMDCSVADSMLKIDTPTALKVQDKIAVHSCLGIRGTSLSRAGKPVKKVLLMNLSDHRCSIRTVIIDPHGIRALWASQMKEDHKGNSEKVKLKQVKESRQVITSSSEDHDQASAKAVRAIAESFEYHSPRLTVPLRKRISDKRMKDQAKTEKTGHGMEKKSKSKSTKVKVNPDKVKVKAEAENEEILNGPTRTHLMGRDSPLRHLKKTCLSLKQIGLILLNLPR